MGHPQTCRVVVACALFVAFAPARGGPEVAPTKTAAGARGVTLNVTQLIASGLQLSALVETGSAADASLLRIA